jgi:hypothetical protein
MTPGNPESVEPFTMSYLVELSVIAQHGQDQIQEDMKNFAEQLKPYLLITLFYFVNIRLFVIKLSVIPALMEIVWPLQQVSSSLGCGMLTSRMRKYTGFFRSTHHKVVDILCFAKSTSQANIEPKDWRSFHNNLYEF